MNHQEAQALVEKLNLIWQTRPRPDLEGRMYGPRWTLDEDELGDWDFYWKAYFGDNMTVELRYRPVGVRITVNFLGDHDGDLKSESECYGEVRWNRHGRVHYSPYVPFAFFEERTKPWMEILRRNVFLSGCPVEATAHEQIEWPLRLQEQLEEAVQHA